MTTLAELKSERESLEPHMQINGGCRRQMFLGDCPTCARGWLLDDQIREADTAAPADGGDQDGE